MSGGKLIGIAVVVLIAGGVIYLKFSNRAEASGDVREAIMSWIVELPCYQENTEKLEEMADRAHEHAFSMAYDMGSRHRSASFDDETYIAEFFGFMIKQAPEVAERLSAGQSVLDLHPSIREEGHLLSAWLDAAKHPLAIAIAFR